jgi:hypothetical protein
MIDLTKFICVLSTVKSMYLDTIVDSYSLAEAK